MFWKVFCELCAKAGKSPNAVGKDIGVSSGSITSWKQGRVPHHGTLIKIADYFGVGADDLLGIGKNEYKTADKKNIIRVPVYGQVAAGIPIEAIEDIEDYEELDGDQYSTGEYLALKIKGRSMEPRMMEGDVVIVRLQPDVETGDTAIVMVNGEEATCKKIKKTPEGISLISTNPAYDPMFYSNSEIESLPVTILGKVVELRAKY